MGVGVLHEGEYVLLSGNQSGSVLIEYILSQLQAKGQMPQNPVMFNTIVTSDLGEKNCIEVRCGNGKDADRLQVHR